MVDKDSEMLYAGFANYQHLSRTTKLVFIVAIINSCRYFELNNFPIAFQKTIDILLVLYFLHFVLTLYLPSKHMPFYKYMHYRKTVWLFVTIPFLSVFGAWIYHSQSPLSTIYVTRGVFFWLMYFWLHYYSVNTKFIFICIFTMCAIHMSIELLQQFTYPVVFFGTDYYKDTVYANGLSIEIRNGFYRFRLTSSIYYCFITLFFSWYAYNKIKNRSFLVLFIIATIGIYLSLSRQFTVASIIPFILIPLFKKSNIIKKIFLIGVVVVSLLLLFMNLDLLFDAELLESTEQSATDENYSRWIGWSYFGLYYWTDWFNVLLGNGIHHGISGNPYAKEIEDLKELYRIVRADIGIVGQFSRWGILYIITVVSFYIRYFVKSKNTPSFLIMLMIASLVSISTVSWIEPIPLVFILYLTDKYTESNMKLSIS